MDNQQKFKAGLVDELSKLETVLSDHAYSHGKCVTTSRSKNDTQYSILKLICGRH